jgi:hypothetical protein
MGTTHQRKGHRQTTNPRSGVVRDRTWSRHRSRHVDAERSGEATAEEETRIRQTTALESGIPRLCETGRGAVDHRPVRPATRGKNISPVFRR